MNQSHDLLANPFDDAMREGCVRSESVLRLDRSGRLTRTYGAKGKGPGEITGIGPLFATESSVHVSSSGTGRILRYSKADGTTTGSYQLVGFLSSVAQDGEYTLFGNYAPDRGTTVTRWRRDSVDSRHMVAIPAEYVASPALGPTFPVVHVATFGDSVLIGFMGTPYLVVSDRSGTVSETVFVPWVRRKTYPSDLDKAMQGSPSARVGQLSALFHLHRRPDGQTVLAYYDHDMVDGVLSSRPFLSLLSRDRRTACLDREMVVSQDSRALMAFSGDTIFVLESQVEADQTRSTITRYLLSAEGYDWVSTKPKGGH